MQHNIKSFKDFVGPIKPRKRSEKQLGLQARRNALKDASTGKVDPADHKALTDAGYTKSSETQYADRSKYTKDGIVMHVNHYKDELGRHLMSKVPNGGKVLHKNMRSALNRIKRDT